MSFSSIVDGVITTITKHANYTSCNVYYEDSRALGGGKARYIAISNGGFNREEITFAAVSHNWNVVLDIYSIYKGELSATRKAAGDDMQSILDTLEAWPRLADTTGVNNFEIASITPIENMAPGVGRNAHVKQQIVLAVQEVSCPSRSE